MKSPDLCPVCRSEAGKLFLHRQGVPVHQNLLMKSAEEARNIVRGDLLLYSCAQCGFVYNQAFDSEKLSYGQAYENAQNHSEAFQTHLDNLARYVVEERDVRQSRIIEVGCGQGDFIRSLLTYPGTKNTGYGFDPSYQGALVDLDGQLNFVNDFYGEKYQNLQADIVVCRHVIEHVPDPVALLKNIRQALSSSDSPRLFFETPCLEWILKNQVIWDFFYEHCSYFTRNSLKTAFELAGFHVDSVQHVFNGQYLWLEATLNKNSPQPSYSDNALDPLLRQYKGAEAASFSEWRQRLSTLNDGNVAIWGAGAKGVTLANLLDPHCQWIDSVVDINPRKQGHFIPGTGHIIIGPSELKERHITHAILMNPNYKIENLSLIQKLNLEIELLTFEHSVKELV